MNTWQQLLQQLGVIGQSGDAGHPGRLIASLAIFIVGLIVLEIIFHLAKRRVQASIAKKGQDPRQGLHAAIKACCCGVAFAFNRTVATPYTPVHQSSA